MSDDAPAVADHRTAHWSGVGAVALLLGGFGVLSQSAALVLAAVAGAAFVGYAQVTRPPRVGTAAGETAVTIDREFDEPAPEPGETVEVTVTVRNDGEGFLPDVRLVDGVPSELEVVDGSPRHGTALRAGASATFAYAVTARRGEHRWQSAQVVLADPSGSIERELRVESEHALYCSLPLLSAEELPLRRLTTAHAGRIETDSGGAGVEFHATREYRPSDPLKRVDWRRRAKTGEFGTLEFREERTATVVLLIDTRRAAYRARTPGGYHAVERSVDAAGRCFAALLDAGNRVGIAAFGSGPEDCWLAPGSGDTHRARGRKLLTEHPALSTVPPEHGLYETFHEDRREELKRRRVERLHRRLPSDAQLFVLSPCCDAYIPEVARRLDAHGHLTTVVSPNPTTDDTPLYALARMEREDHLRRLRRRNLRVVDWRAEEPFASALARARSRWVA